MRKMVSPSMMCADFMRLKETLAVFESKNIEFLHIDVMDGRFVPNFTLGADFCKQLKRECRIPLDIHLMIMDPEERLDLFPFGKGDIVSIHCEATRHIQRTLSMIRDRGAHPVLALNPATPLSVLDYVIDDIDGVLVMTVNPGFAGQKMVSSSLSKIHDAGMYLESRKKGGCMLEVDGNVSFENAKRMSDAGANVFVAGTSSVFSENITLEDGIDRLRDVI